MDLSFFITELLHQNDEVSVPYFGTFSRKKTDGYYNSDTGMFSPPSENLSFSSHSDDDELLAEYISRQKNISLSSSKYFISKFVATIKSVLENEGQAELKNLGTIEKDKDAYTFKSSGEIELAGNYFGMHPVKEIHSENTIAPEPEITELIQDPSEISGQEFIEEIPDEKGMKTGTKLMVAAVVLILAAGLLYLFNPQAYISLLSPNTVRVESKIPIEPVKNSATVPLVTDSAESASIDSAGNKITVTTPTTDSAQVVNESLNSDLPTFEIIGAAFEKRDEAEAFVKTITSRGLYAQIVDRMPGSKVKVSFGSFTDEQEAQKELIRIKKHLNKDAWLARVKPKKIN